MTAVFVEVLIIKKYGVGRQHICNKVGDGLLYDLRINAGNVDLKITSWREMIGTVSTF